MRRACCALLFVMAGVINAASQTPAVARIEIVSRWGGYSFTPVPATRVAIIRDEGGYRRGRQPIAPALVDDLTAALREPLSPEPTLDGIGITQAWLTANVATVRVRNATVGGPRRDSPAALALFKVAFTDPAAIAEPLKRVFKCDHTDDYPRIDIVVSYTSGDIARVSSTSQCALMLPWSVNGNATFNPRLSRAVAALLPARATNAGRFSDDELLSALVDRVLISLQPQFNLLDVDARAPGALERLRSRLTVQRAEINQYHHVTYGIAWMDTPQFPERLRETNLHASVRDTSSPPSLTTSLVLRIENGEVPGLDTFLATHASYSARVLSVPWLRAFIDSHPQIPVRIDYIQDASLGDKALRNFVLDMTKLGRTALAREVSKQRSGTVLLTAGLGFAETHWLLLPDDRLILWRSGGPSGLLRWTPTDFPEQECSEYRPSVEKCVGAVIDRDGTLQP
jgi:hypothetical protein